MFVEKFKVKIEGLVPLLHHKFVNNTEGKKKRYVPDDDAKEVLYTDDAGNIIHPANHIEAAMKKAAVNFKLPGAGKKTLKDAICAGIFISPILIPLKDKWEVDLKAVIIGRARIMRARPIFNKWSLEFEIANIDERLTPKMVEDVLTEAGLYVGIGDYRPKYGRFKVISFKKVSSKSKKE